MKMLKQKRQKQTKLNEGDKSMTSYHHQYPKQVEVHHHPTAKKIIYIIKNKTLYNILVGFYLNK